MNPLSLLGQYSDEEEEEEEQILANGSSGGVLAVAVSGQVDEKVPMRAFNFRPIVCARRTSGAAQAACFYPV